MNLRKVAAIGAVIIGVVCIGVSSYIKHEVAEGKEKISHAEKQVSQGNALLSLTPATKEIGKGLSQSANKKIDEGKEEVHKYAVLARELQIGGIALLALGAISFLIMCTKK